MPQTPHIERHFTGSAAIRDVVIGMANGLTVPFALAAGLSGAVDSTAIIITAGLAEIAAHPVTPINPPGINDFSSPRPNSDERNRLQRNQTTASRRRHGQMRSTFVEIKDQRTVDDKE